MNEGLITRIGKWIDNKWESKATYRELQNQESKCSERHIGSLELFSAGKKEIDAEIEEMRKEVLLKLASYKADSLTADKELRTSIDRLNKTVGDILEAPEEDKGLAELTTRIERLEVYGGMARKVDPTKPPVVKSAFSM